MTTKRRPAGARPAARSAGSGRGSRPSSSSRIRPASTGRGASRRGGGKAAASPTLLDSALAVLAAHAEDLWGLTCATVGVLAGLALYFDALGPIGHEVRHGLGAAFGVGRFLLPVACVAAGILLVVGRPRHEPARTVLGLALSLTAVAGLADLAGGSPRLGAPVSALSGAGGWLGSAVGGPLRAGLAGFGAAVVLLAVLALALVLFTGITLKAVGRTLVGGGSRLWEAARAAWDARATRPEDTVVQMPAPSAPNWGEEPAPMADQVPDPAPAMPVAEPGPAGADEPDAAPVVDAEEPAEVAAGTGRTASARPAAAMELDGGPHAGEWRLPPGTLLGRSKQQQLEPAELAAAGDALVEALRAHGVETRLVGRTVGPTVTRFELELGPGIKVARVTSLAKDIAYAMASPDVRILAPIPGKSAIGVEVPNRRRQLVTLGDVLGSAEARDATHPLEVALGRDIAGRAVMANLAEMPHILISGATGAGKSSCINSVITSIMMRATPEDVRLILVDPKRVELGQYNGLPHLLTQVVVDPKRAANALSWAVTEMERRYDLLAEAGVRDITGYNEAVEAGLLDDGGAASGDDHADIEDDIEDGAEDASAAGVHAEDVRAAVAARMAESRGVVDPPVVREKLPFVLVVVDELNDLMMVAARDVEESVCRIAQMARAVGIHLVLATQRPSV
ncbi:MAG TPA: DNA translocase FtsK 4TM domain-containing protein, partial [Acidimicrobiales bacterium]|nr:DNA translocase FtsK 4TM domain-containing protein [Acidimicrobiales bacterium]